MCPSLVVEPCEDLPRLESTDQDELKRKAGKWAGLYGVCKFKHEVVIECLRAYEEK